MYTFHYKFNVTKIATSMGDSDTHTYPFSIELSVHEAENAQTLNSTGFTIWRASFHMCDFLVKCHNSQQHSTNTHADLRPYDMMSERRVLELGSGLGLCGILAHRLGSTTTILTDGDTNALELMQQSMHRNINCQGSNLGTAMNGSGTNTKPGDIQ